MIADPVLNSIGRRIGKSIYFSPAKSVMNPSCFSIVRLSPNPKMSFFVKGSHIDFQITLISRQRVKEKLIIVKT